MPWTFNQLLKLLSAITVSHNINPTVSFLQANSFIMKIENYNKQLEEAKTTEKSICSNPHIICGFKMRLMVYLNGNGTAKRTHMSVFFQLMKGEFDDCLEWPFNKLISLVLIDPDHKDKCHKLLLYDPQKKFDKKMTYYGKPDTVVNPPWGFAEFVTHEKLHADGFIKNDTLYIRTVIE